MTREFTWIAPGTRNRKNQRHHFPHAMDGQAPPSSIRKRFVTGSVSACREAKDPDKKMVGSRK